MDYIHISGKNNIEYIPENIFGNFLDNNANNTLKLTNNSLNCNNKTNYLWLLLQKEKYQKQIISAFCNDGTNIFEFGMFIYSINCISSNFDHHYFYFLNYEYIHV